VRWQYLTDGARAQHAQRDDFLLQLAFDFSQQRLVHCSSTLPNHENKSRQETTAAFAGCMTELPKKITDLEFIGLATFAS
jgi:hypothetical protein